MENVKQKMPDLGDLVIHLVDNAMRCATYT
jgi:hypothetical protein